MESKKDLVTVRIRGTLEVRYDQKVKLDRSELNQLKKLFNADDERRINEFCFGCVNLDDIYDSEEELEDTEVSIIDKDGNEEELYSGQNYEIDKDEDDFDDDDDDDDDDDK